jgi:hypothetical protein
MFQGKSVGTIAFEAVPGAAQEVAPDDIPF